MGAGTIIGVAFGVVFILVVGALYTYLEFEKEKSVVCIPFYDDDTKTLSTIANNFFRKKNVSISREMINLIVDRCRGDRQNLKIELQKISSLLNKLSK